MSPHYIVKQHILNDGETEQHFQMNSLKKKLVCLQIDMIDLL